MKKGFLPVVSMIMAISAASYGQRDWVLKKQKDGISVFSLKEENSKFNLIKVEATLKGTVSDLVAILLNVESHLDWAFDTKYVSMLKKLSEQELLYYKQIQSPITVKNRDLVLHLKVMEDADLQSAKVESFAEPNYIPEKEDFVRVKVSNEKWKVTQQQNQTIRIDYFLEIDPGGTISPGIVNLFSAQGPYESFEKLRVILSNKLKEKK